MIQSKYGEGLTVGELREKMKDIPDETPVVGYWETIYVPLNDAEMGETVFVLDVDQ